MSAYPITFGQIREYVAQHLESCSAQDNPFLYAYDILLKNQGSSLPIRSDGGFDLPDFMSWDLSDPVQLCGLIDRIPVREDKKELLPLRPFSGDNPSLLYLPSTVPFFIGRELPCLKMTPHIDDCFTLLYVYHGKCTLRLDGNDHIMGAGELCIISPHTVRCHTLGKEDLVIGVLIHRPAFEHSLFRALRRNNPLSDFFRNVLFRSEKGYLFFALAPSPVICQVIQHLFQEYTHRDEYSTDLFGEYLDILFAELMRSHEHTYRHYSREHLPVFIILPHILSYIQAHFSTLTMKQLAYEFHYDRAYLSRQIRRYTGKTYTEIIAEYRLEKAKEYLCHTDRKISEVAEQTGFHSSDHFTRFFRQHTGVSPREYRKTHHDLLSR